MSGIRRIIVAAILIIAALCVVTWANNPNLVYSLLTEEVDGETLTAPEAHAAAIAGDIILVDIRRPDEWAATGSGEGAHRLDLRQDGFIAALTGLANGRTDAQIAVICARGVRSARTANRLMEAGFTNIIDVPEGMLGSAAGPGWLRRGLPLNTGP